MNKLFLIYQGRKNFFKKEKLLVILNQKHNRISAEMKILIKNKSFPKSRIKETNLKYMSLKQIVILTIKKINFLLMLIK
jgi:hypothetical protein